MQNWVDSGFLAGFEDDRLVELAQGGDQLAYAELVRRHKPACMKTALSILRDWQDAEDDTQIALWKAYQHLAGFQRDSKFSTWLTRIVVNQCLMRIRRRKRARFLFIDEGVADHDLAVIELASRDRTPEQSLASSEMAAVLDREIRRIPPLLRNVFLLREVHQLPMAAVAQRLGISVCAAKTRLLRARVELRERLRKHCGRLGAATLTAEA
ncbi:MAG: sigma-70 family RNA polymerase sigma factor [Acidobacteria bacterium]|nr:sigma-70 family RNA polymerase sigma factor [Acidobacteriota bacterium]